MSRKNHTMRNGMLIQKDKRFSQLKEKQKEKISSWIAEETMKYYEAHGKMSGKRQDDIILRNVYEQIEKAEIWLPFYELKKRYHSKKAHIQHKCLERAERQEKIDSHA